MFRVLEADATPLRRRLRAPTPGRSHRKRARVKADGANKSPTDPDTVTRNSRKTLRGLWARERRLLLESPSRSHSSGILAYCSR